MMWLKSLLICFVVVLPVASQAKAVQMNQAIIKAFLDEHNVARAAVKMPPLKWSDALSKSAQNWALRCEFDHSETSNGENLFASSPRSNSYSVVAKESVKSWVSEKNFVKKDWACAFRLQNTCGHYSQVVWKNTKTVGCAIVHCNNDLANYVVCQYSPGGNVLGEKPY